MHERNLGVDGGTVSLDRSVADHVRQRLLRPVGDPGHVATRGGGPAGEEQREGGLRSGTLDQIAGSGGEDILLVSLEASANLKLKHPVRFHQQHHATLSNDLARLKHESIHEQEYAAIALSLPSILDGGQS